VTALYLVKAGDPVLRSRAAQALVDELLDGEDRTLVVEEFVIPPKKGAANDEPAASAGSDDALAPIPVVAGILNAAQSPPFMTSKRIVVVRDYEQLNADEAAPVAAVLADLLESTVFVFVGGGGRAPKSLADALKSAEVVGPDSEKTTDVLAAELERADLTLGKDAAGSRRTGWATTPAAPRVSSRSGARRSGPASRSPPPTSSRISVKRDPFPSSS